MSGRLPSKRLPSESAKLKKPLDNIDPMIKLDDMSDSQRPTVGGTYYTVTLRVLTDADPSLILDQAHQLGEFLTEELHTYGHEATIDEQDTCVSEADDQG